MKNLYTILVANELKVSGTILRIPYGTYEHALGVQVFGKDEATACVAAFNEKKAKPGFKGSPFYIGHPDVPEFYDKYRDHSAYGRIKMLIANEDHLAFYVKWTPEGEKLIANEAFVYWSPLFYSKRVGGKLHPHLIRSAGLTQEPNIEYLAVACEHLLQDEPSTKENTMNNLLERLKALINKDDVQTEDEVVGFVQKMIDALKKLRDSIKDKWTAEDVAYDVAANERLVDEALKLFTQLDEDLASANEAVPESATSTITQLNEELATANESMSRLQASHSTLLLDGALQDGRITPATRKKWETRFNAEGADFEAVANELSSIDPVMKTQSTVKGKKPSDAELPTHTDLKDSSIAMANERKIPYQEAYNACRKQEKFAHLFPSE